MFGNTGMNDFGFDVIRPTHFGSMQRQREADARSERYLAQTDKRLAQRDRSLDLAEKKLEESKMHHREQEDLAWARIDAQAERHQDNLAYKQYQTMRHEYEFDYKANERFKNHQDKLDMFNQRMAYNWAKLNRQEHQGGK